MLNPRLRAFAESLLPGVVVRALDPFEARMGQAVEEFSQSLPNGSRVLDAGAGESRYARLFDRHRYVALDLAVGDVAWNYSGLDLFGDLESLPLAANSFDAAINVVTLEHVKRPQLAIDELARVLRPGGRLLLVVPLEWEVHQAPHDYFRYTCYGLSFLLETAGMTPQRLEPVGGFYWLMARRSVNFLAFFQGGAKWILFALLAPFFGLLFPLALYAVDGLDRRRDFTLGYVCEAVKRTDLGK
jgi:SAM-dependent methyltransferase